MLKMRPRLRGLPPKLGVLRGRKVLGMRPRLRGLPPTLLVLGLGGVGMMRFRSRGRPRVESHVPWLCEACASKLCRLDVRAVSPRWRLLDHVEN